MSNLPKGWELKYIEDIAEVKGGKRLPTGSFLSEDITPYPYIRVTNMYMGGIDFSDILYVPEDIQPQIKNYTISKNDLFISVAGTLGIVGEVPEELDNANLTENADKLTNIKINRKFLLYVLMSNLIQNEIKNQTTSNAQPKLALSRIKQFQIPVPPLEEQKKIADILSIVDKKIVFVEENINATEELKKGLMQKLLTEGIGHKEFKDSELGRIPENWEVIKIEDITELVTKGTTPTTLGYQYESSGINFIKIESIDKNGNFDKSSFAYISEEANIALKRSIILENDLLYSIAGALGRVAIVNKSILPANTNQALSIIRLKDKSNVKYIYFYLNSPYIKNHIDKVNVQNAQANLSLQHIKNFKIAMPPLEEQKQIAEILSTVDKKLENLKEKKQSFEELKKGLMQKLLTGEVRI